MRPALMLVATALCAAGCKDETTSPITPPRVAATPQLTFAPASLQITRGTTVTWVFGTVPHNVTFAAVAGRPADIPGQNVATSVDRTFSTAGTFAYTCTLHPGMAGSVTVAPPPTSYLLAR